MQSNCRRKSYFWWLSNHGLWCVRNPIYAHSESLQEQIRVNGYGIILLDLHPHVQLESLIERLSLKRSKISLPNYLRKNGKLSAVKASLLREFLDVEVFRKSKSLRAKN